MGIWFVCNSTHACLVPKEVSTHWISRTGGTDSCELHVNGCWYKSGSSEERPHLTFYVLLGMPYTYAAGTLLTESIL